MCVGLNSTGVLLRPELCGMSSNRAAACSLYKGDHAAAVIVFRGRKHMLARRRGLKCSRGSNRRLEAGARGLGVRLSPDNMYCCAAIYSQEPPPECLHSRGPPPRQSDGRRPPPPCYHRDSYTVNRATFCLSQRSWAIDDNSGRQDHHHSSSSSAQHTSSFQNHLDVGVGEISPISRLRCLTLLHAREPLYRQPLVR